VQGGNGRYLSNAGRAESYGVELSLQAVLTDALAADLNYGYTHAAFSDYDNEREDYSGKYIPYTPRHTFSLGLNYSRPLRSCWLDRIMASAQANGAGKIYWTERNDISQEFYTVVNAQIGVCKGAVSLLFWTRNLTDTDYSTFYFESFNKSFMQRAKPFQAGATLKLSL
jgi:outer membrane receptor protein involved in Fe transport